MKFQESRDKLSQLLKDNLTADNTEFISQANAILKELDESHTNLQEENTKLKDKLVDYVSKVEFKETPKNEVEDTTKTLDEALTDEIDKIIKERKN